MTSLIECIERKHSYYTTLVHITLRFFKAYKHANLLRLEKRFLFKKYILRFLASIRNILSVLNEERNFKSSS